MGGIFGVASKSSCVLDLFFGIDYHSHLGTRRGGMAVYDPAKGFDRAIHNIENSPFRTKFDRDVSELQGNLGIGCISDNEPQPLLVRSHLGNFAITTVGKINNMEELVEHSFKNGSTHFLGNERRKCESYRNGCISDQSEVNYGRGNPLCTGNDRRIYDHADPDSKGTFCSQRSSWKNSSYYWKKRRMLGVFPLKAMRTSTWAMKMKSLWDRARSWQ